MEQPTTSKAFDMEQLFQNGGVFINALKGTPAHMDSYMTVMDFVKFFATWEQIKDKFTREEWVRACKYWHSQNYLSPMAGLLARMVENKLNPN